MSRLQLALHAVEKLVRPHAGPARNEAGQWHFPESRRLGPFHTPEDNCGPFWVAMISLRPNAPPWSLAMSPADGQPFLISLKSIRPDVRLWMR